MRADELKHQAEEIIRTIYGPDISTNLKQNLIDMFLLGYSEGFNISIQLGMSEDIEPEELLHQLEETNDSLTVIRDEMLKRSQLEKIKVGK